jgi:uncharacterized protein
MKTPRPRRPDRRAIVRKTAAHVRAALAGEGSGHDGWHAWRVWRTAARLARIEKADPFVVALAALLHDIADWKLHGGDTAAGPARATAWLRSLGVDARTVDRVGAIIRDLSFKGARVRAPRLDLEGRVVQDADRLDALGAIGIARAFAYGGSRGRPIHEPGVRPVRHRTAAAYLRGGGHTINHFHEKLLLLRDRLNTAAARRLAAGRHAYLEQFLKRFHDEWAGRR